MYETLHVVHDACTVVHLLYRFDLQFYDEKTVTALEHDLDTVFLDSDSIEQLIPMPLFKSNGQSIRTAFLRSTGLLARSIG